MTAPRADLSDVNTFRDGFPHDFFAWLRANDPVYWHEPTEHTPDGEGFWVISRHADAVAVLRDASTFSSERGGHREHGGTQLKDHHSAGVTLNQMDDPRHQKVRRLISTGFTPRMIGKLEGDLKLRTADILDAVPDENPFDFVQWIARELPLQVTCTILGVPQEDRVELGKWVDLGIETDSEEILAREYMQKLTAYGAKLIEEKRRKPSDDVLSVVIHAKLEEDASQLSDREVLGFFGLLFPAGVETTRSAIGGGMKALVDNPTQLERLQTNGGLTDASIEEIVRWTTPSIYKRRTATRDVELEGKKIRAGDKVTFWEMSANRDEQVFDSPFRFDVTRSPNPHIGFGNGVHFCLGANLARLEIRILFNALLDRYSSFELVGEPVWAPNSRLLGLKHLPIRATRRA